MRVVLKYGGSSVSDISKIQAIASYIMSLKNQGDELIVVVSAMGKTTDGLIAHAKSLAAAPNIREMDALLVTGELQTTALLAIALDALGVKAISLSGRQAGIETTGIYTKSLIKNIDPTVIEKHLEEGKVVVVAGFQGVNAQGDLTTLGRGGSDTSAVALAATLGCECRIYTDVDGVYGIDPRIYSKAKMLEKISYDEMIEMAHLGAKVVETRAVEIGKKYGVPLFIGRSLAKNGGTYIVEKDFILEDKLITGISLCRDIEIVTLSHLEHSHQIIAGVFHILDECHININLIVQNAHDGIARLSFSTLVSERYLLDEALQKIKNFSPNVHVDILGNVSMLSLVGIGMINNFGIVGRFFTALSRAGVEFYQVSTSEISISCSIPRALSDIAAVAAAKEFGL